VFLDTVRQILAGQCPTIICNFAKKIASTLVSKKLVTAQGDYWDLMCLGELAACWNNDSHDYYMKYN